VTVKTGFDTRSKIDFVDQFTKSKSNRTWVAESKAHKFLQEWSKRPDHQGKYTPLTLPALIELYNGVDLGDGCVDYLALEDYFRERITYPPPRKCYEVSKVPSRKRIETVIRELYTGV
jgi:hypothetical protein